MESKMEQRVERSKIVIDKMKFEVVDKYPRDSLETDMKKSNILYYGSSR